MIRETFPVGFLMCNCTVLGDETSREAIVVDPGDNIPQILSTLARHQLTVKQIIITHAHIDHIAGALSLKQITGAPILYNKADLAMVAIMDQQAGWLNMDTPDVLPPDHAPADNEIVSVRGIDTQVIYTPGHTPGSICLHVPAESLLLAGDTLFYGSVGRTDLPGGNHDQLLSSIHERLLPLPGDTVVVPGHGSDTTISDEARSNPFLT